MESLALIGVSHRRGGASAIELWQKYYSDRPLSQILDWGFREVVLISTCNRCDLVVSLPPEMSVKEAKVRLAPSSWPNCYAFVGEGALEQLIRIASSLDSLNPGEFQIMNQVREAFARAEREGTVGKETRFAFTTAFRIAKKIRSQVHLAPLNTSLFSLAKPELEKYLPQRAKVGILGAGEIAQSAAKIISQRPDTALFIVNRTFRRAQLLAESLTPAAVPLSLSEFLSSPPDLDALICATSKGELITPPLLKKLPSLRAIVDLGIPRNVSPEVRSLPIFDVDTLREAGERRRKQILQNLISAEEILLRELELATDEWLEKQLGPIIKKLREEYLRSITDELPASQAQRLVNRFSKYPISGVKALARRYGISAAYTFLDAMTSQ